MGQLVEVQVPDIGDFKDVEVIEVLVKPGDTVAKEQSLITVESDKASMEIPSSAAGSRQGTAGEARRQGRPGQPLCSSLKPPTGRPPPASSPRHRRRRPRHAANAAAAAPSAAAPAPAPAAGPIEVVVPDIGDFKDVEVIEILVKPGDTVTQEQSLITVESDKASMEIPSSAAGVVRELRVKIGDKVSKGSPVAVLDRRRRRRIAGGARRRRVASGRASSAAPVGSPEVDRVCHRDGRAAATGRSRARARRQAARLAVGAQVRARTRCRSHPRARQRAEGPHHDRRRPRPRQGRDGGRCTSGRCAGCGRRHRASDSTCRRGR